MEFFYINIFADIMYYFTIMGIMRMMMMIIIIKLLTMIVAISILITVNNNHNDNIKIPESIVSIILWIGCLIYVTKYRYKHIKAHEE